MFLTIKFLPINSAFCVIAMLLTLTGCGGSSSAPAAPNTVDIPVDLSGDFSVSATTPNPAAAGSGTLTLSRDTGALSGSISYTNLSTPVTNAHIHTGLAGIAGAAVVQLDFATIPDVSVPPGTILTGAQMSALLNADYYINVHTQANLDGVLRGQILPANFQVIRTLLDGGNVYPTPTGSPNTGIGFLTINTDTLSVRGNITNTGLDNANVAHIHGPASTTANATDIVSYAKDAVDPALWEIPSTESPVTQIIMDYILAGQTYINVHSAINGFPLGEIRGQIVP